MKCFWVFAAGAFAAFSGAQTTLWVGEPKLKEDQLMERASRLGQVLAREGKLVRLKTDRPAVVKKQFSLVLPGTAHELIRTNLNSVRDHVAFVKHQGKARPGKRKLPSFLSALEYFLRGRVDVEGNLRTDLWRKAIEQRERLPKAKREWFGNAENVTGEWSYVGPKSLNPPYRQYFGTLSLSGRKTDAAYAPSDPEIIWTTSAGGGAWKSTNGGTTWSPKSDDWESLYTASVAIHPTNPDVVYIGTGDPVGQFSSLANGVMKTTDGGQTWEGPYGGPYFFDRTVTKILVYPDDPSTVIATAANARTWQGLNSSFEGGSIAPQTAGATGCG